MLFSQRISGTNPPQNALKGQKTESPAKFVIWKEFLLKDLVEQDFHLSVGTKNDKECLQSILLFFLSNTVFSLLSYDFFSSHIKLLILFYTFALLFHICLYKPYPFFVYLITKFFSPDNVDRTFVDGICKRI